MHYFDISVKSGEGIEELFNEVLQQLLQYDRDRQM